MGAAAVGLGAAAFGALRLAGFRRGAAFVGAAFLVGRFIALRAFRAGAGFFFALAVVFTGAGFFLALAFAFFAAALVLAPSFSALRASRYFLIFAFATPLCSAQTIPKTGAAGFVQPGTGQSCLGAFFLGFAPRVIADTLASRPGRVPLRALSTACRARSRVSRSIRAASRAVKSSTSDWIPVMTAAPYLSRRAVGNSGLGSFETARAVGRNESERVRVM